VPTDLFQRPTGDQWLTGRRLRLGHAASAALGIASALVPAALAPAAQAQGGALFRAVEVDPQRFVLVAAPIGSGGTRAQLNIYEQVNPRRPCFAVGQGKPAIVDPLLATFDFTGICSRYIDANGYSLRVGANDLATVYRVMVSRTPADTLLLAIPTKPGAGPEMVVARSQGAGSGFLKLELEPGWRLMRRSFGGRNLGHLYIFNESWPTAQATSQPTTQPPAVAAPGKLPPPPAKK